MSWRYTSLVRSGHWSEPNSCLKQHRQRHNNPESMGSLSAAAWLLMGTKALNRWSDSVFDLDQNDLLFPAQGSSGKTSTSGLDLPCESCCHRKNIMPIYKWFLRALCPSLNYERWGNTNFCCQKSLFRFQFFQNIFLNELLFLEEETKTRVCQIVIIHLRILMSTNLVYLETLNPSKPTESDSHRIAGSINVFLWTMYSEVFGNNIRFQALFLI